MNDLIQKWLPEIKKYWFVPVMVLVGVLLMIRQSDSKASVEVVNQTTTDAFIAETEQRVTKMLADIDGAGECVVTITLSSGGKKEYVREEGSVLVITDENGNQSAVVSKESAPEIAGVTIVSDQIQNVAVQTKIIRAVSTLLGIGSNKICVIMSE